jgi:putative acetyltransferase
MQIHFDTVAHASDFIRLNETWISEHFRIEESDRELARDPMQLVREGGTLITLTEAEVVVGTCALLKESAERYQLARMTVAEDQRGKGLGHLLMRTALKKAADLGAAQVYLLTNTQLESAVRLYRRHGFHVVHEGSHPKYARCNLIMQINLAHGERASDGPLSDRLAEGV